MSRLRTISIASALLFLLATPQLAAKGWERMKAYSIEAKSVAKEESIEILATRNDIIVSTSQPVEIKIFTILGRLVTADSLEPGVSRYHISAHGVYIVKAGELTCKVAI